MKCKYAEKTLGTVGYDVGCCPDWTIVITAQERTLEQSQLFSTLLEITTDSNCSQVGEGWDEKSAERDRKIALNIPLTDYFPLSDPLPPAYVSMFVLGIAAGVRNFSQMLSHDEARERIFKAVKDYLNTQEKSNDQEEDQENSEEDNLSG